MQIQLSNCFGKRVNYADMVFMDATFVLEYFFAITHVKLQFLFKGFIVVASCVMTFEARDSAAKVVPARFKVSAGRNRSGAPGSRRTTSKQIFRKNTNSKIFLKSLSVFCFDKRPATGEWSCGIEFWFYFAKHLVAVASPWAARAQSSNPPSYIIVDRSSHNISLFFFVVRCGWIWRRN